MKQNEFFLTAQKQVNQALKSYLPNIESTPELLHHAMQYAVLNNGKRFRPALVYAAGQICEADPDILNGPACAVEIIHAYSLIHDDLPAMDDSPLRRGQPSCHIQFDEATAILAGDSLQSLAFEIIATYASPILAVEQRLAMLAVLAKACGTYGMAGGQAIDLNIANNITELADLQHMHQLKTGALIRASLKMGLLGCNITDEKLHTQLDHYGQCVGLAFQIQDDIIDVESSTELLGKPQGIDADNNKITFPQLIGLTESKHMARDLIEEALTAIDDVKDKASGLIEIAHHTISRCK